MNKPLPLPSKEWQCLIDQSVHAAVSTIKADDKGKCAHYAIVGARVLNQMFSQNYQAVSGGEIIDCGAGKAINIYPTRGERRNARRLSELRNFHCWIEAPHWNEKLNLPSRVIVDFTSRHDASVAKMYGIDFDRQDNPDFIWADYYDAEKEYHPAILNSMTYKSFVWKDEICSNLLARQEQDNLSAYAHLTALAMNHMLELTAQREDLARMPLSA